MRTSDSRRAAAYVAGDAHLRPARRHAGRGAPVTTRHVSRAMSNSSSVGMTQSATRYPSASTQAYVPVAAAFFAASMRIPSQSNPSQMRARTSGEFSPMPPANAIASAPFMAAR